MAAAAAAIAGATSRRVDAALYWPSFSALCKRLDLLVAEEPPPSPAGSETPLGQLLQEVHNWLLLSLAQFRPPNSNSRSALEAPNVEVGTCQLQVKEGLKKVALEASTHLNLDEVQSYILVTRTLNDSAKIDTGHRVDTAVLFSIASQYFLERQSLLMCIRTLLTLREAEDIWSIDEVVQKEANQLIQEGLLSNILSLLQNQLVEAPPIHLSKGTMDLWVEERSMELSLLFDILFLYFYEVDSTFEQVQMLIVCLKTHLLGSREDFPTVNFLAVTPKAALTLQRVKKLAVLVLIESLCVENLLIMVQQGKPFRSGGYPYSLEQVRKLDLLMQQLDPSVASEYAPVLLAWAVLTRLLSTLPDEPLLQTHIEPAPPPDPIDYAAYMQAACSKGALPYLRSILCDEALMEEEMRMAGYESVIKSLMSGLLAAYNFADQNQMESEGIRWVVTILTNAFRGQEVLCNELWDRNVVMDEPIRSLLFSQRDEFPYRVIPLVRLSAALCEGAWSTDHVYDFLHKRAHVTTAYQAALPALLPAGSLPSLSLSASLPVPAAPGLLIPAGTRGRVLRLLDGGRALVQWQCEHSTILVLLLRALSRSRTLESSKDSEEEVEAVLEFLDRMLQVKKEIAVLLLTLDDADSTKAARLDGRMDPNMRIDVVAILCGILQSLVQLSSHNVGMLGACVRILAALASCFPAKVATEFRRSGLMDQPFSRVAVYENEENVMEGSMLQKLLRNCEKVEGRYPLTLACLSLTAALLKRGLLTDVTSRLVHYALSEIWVNHNAWRYKRRVERWEIAAKVLQVTRLMALACRGKGPSPALKSFDGTFHHEALFLVLALTPTVMEEEQRRQSIKAAELEVLLSARIEALNLLTNLFDTGKWDSKEMSGASPFEVAFFRHVAGSGVSLVAAVGSHLTCFQSPSLQEAAMRALIPISITAERLSLNITGYFTSASLGESLRDAMGRLLSKAYSESYPSTFAAALGLLVTALQHEASLLELLLAPQPNTEGGPLCSPALDALQTHLLHAPAVAAGSLETQSKVLYFLSGLWEKAGSHSSSVEYLRSRDTFWQLLAAPLALPAPLPPSPSEAPTHSFAAVGSPQTRASKRLRNKSEREMQDMASRFQCEAYVLRIMAVDIFEQRQRNLKATRKKTTTNNGVMGNVAPQNVPGQGGGQSGEKGAAALESKALQVIREWHKFSGKEVKDSTKIFAENVVDLADIMRAQAAMRVLVVGLMVEAVEEKHMGINVALLGRVRDAAEELLKDPAAANLMQHYVNSISRSSASPAAEFLGELYKHLEGELEEGRAMPPAFRKVTEFLEKQRYDLVLRPIRDDLPAVVRPLYGGNFPFDLKAIEEDLGLQWWEDGADTGLNRQVVANVLCTLGRMNAALSTGDAQAKALRSWAAVLQVAVLHSEKQVREGASDLWSCWGAPALEGSLECLSAALVSAMTEDSAITGVRLLDNLKTAQAGLLLHLIRLWTSRFALPENDHLEEHPVSDKGKAPAFPSGRSGEPHSVPPWELCTKLVDHCFGCLARSVAGSGEIDEQAKGTVEPVLSSLLLLLGLVKGYNVYETKKGNSAGDGKLAELVREIVFKLRDFLPTVFRLAVVGEYSTLGISVIHMTLKGFLDISVVTRIMEGAHTPLSTLLCSLRGDLPVQKKTALVELTCTLAQANEGASLLLSARIFQILQEYAHDVAETREGSGPVDMVTADDGGDDQSSLWLSWEKWSPSPERTVVWKQALRLAALLMRTLSTSAEGPFVAEQLVGLLMALRVQVLRALQVPIVGAEPQRRSGLLGGSGGTSQRRRRPELRSSLSALMGLGHVALFLAEAARFGLGSRAGRGVVGRLVEFAQASAALLDCIASKGGGGGDGEGVGVKFSCLPEGGEEKQKHKEPAFVMGIDKGWFRVTAQGVMPQIASLSEAEKADGTDGSKGVGNTFGSGVGAGTSIAAGTSQSLPEAHSRYTNELAIKVYSITFYLLQFHCHLLAVEIQEGGILSDGTLTYNFSPLPSKMVLHAIQDQAFAVLTQICSVANGGPLKRPFALLWGIMAGTLERALFLEKFLDRVQTLPAAWRVEAVMAALAALKQAAGDHETLAESVQDVEAAVRSTFQL